MLFLISSEKIHQLNGKLDEKVNQFESSQNQHQYHQIKKSQLQVNTEVCDDHIDHIKREVISKLIN